MAIAFLPVSWHRFADSNTRAKIMSLLDMRVVQIIFGDNANLTASAAKALGALLHSSIQDDPAAVDLRDKLELFIARQEDGYRQLYDERLWLVLLWLECNAQTAIPDGKTAAETGLSGTWIIL